MFTLSIIVFSLFVFLLFMLFHVFVWRLLNNNSPRLVILSFVFLISYLISIIIYKYIFKIDLSVHFWLSGPTSFCLFIFYVHFYVGMLKSVSFRIMSEIISRKNNEISLNELQKIYSFEGMVEPRLNLLVTKDWLKIKNKKYFCTKFSKNVVYINLFLHKLFRLKITG